MKREDGGRAFPAPDCYGNFQGLEADRGMTLRDWFAGQAIAALIHRHRVDVPWETLGPRAYNIADAMLKAREIPHD